MPSDEPHALLLGAQEDIVPILEGRTEMRLKKVLQMPADIKEKLKASETHINLLVYTGGDLEARVSLPRDKQLFFSEDEDYRTAVKHFCRDTHFDWTDDLADAQSTCAKCRKVATGMSPCPKCCMVSYCDDHCRTLHHQHIDVCNDIALERRHNINAQD